MKALWLILVSVCVVSLSAVAGLIEVGNGTNSANVYIEWSDGYIAEFLVKFDGSTTGLALLQTIDNALANFSLDIQDYGWGAFINGITYDSHSNIGYGGGENWWHYWTKDAGENNWAMSWIGAADRVVNHGDADGWIYGRDGAPVPEPATMALIAAGLAIAAFKRK